MNTFLRPEICLWRNPIVAFFAIALLSCLISGCERAEIAVFKNKGQTRPLGRKLADPGERIPSRMVVTIYENSDTLWTFKIVGRKSDIDNEHRWRPFVESVEFGQDGKPEWELPENWREGQSSQFVYAKIFIPPDTAKDYRQLEISVSDLPAGQDMTANVNRWRGQLALPPKQNAGEDMKSRTIEGRDGERTVKVYDEIGVSSGSMSRGGPGRGGPSRTGQPQFEIEKIRYQVPEDWAESNSVSPLIRKFEKLSDELKVEVSVTQLPAQTIAWNEVVTMWAAQVGLEELSQEEVENKTTKLTIGSIEAFRTRLDSTGEDNRSIVGIMVTKNRSSFFIKMVGDSRLVESEQENFSKMVDSIHFDSGE